MARRRAGMEAAFNPWTWVLLAALVRLAALLALMHVGHHAVVNEAITTRSRHGPLDPRPGLLAFLQERHQYHSLTEDEDCYDEMARNLVAGRGFVLDRVWQITVPGRPSLYAGCTYPLFVAACYRAFGVGRELPVYLAQIALHALAAGLLVAAARRVAGPVAGLVAGAYYTFHPTLIWSAVALMSESLVVPLVALLTWALDPQLGRRALGRPADGWRCAGLGALLATLCLTRSTFAYFGAIVLPLLLALEPRRRDRAAAVAGRVALYLLAFALTTAPWAVRNYVHYRRFIPFSTKQGSNAYVFNNEGLVPELGIRAVRGRGPLDLYGPEFAAIPTEVERDALCMRLFRRFVREHPGRFAGLIAARAGIAVLPLAAVAQVPAAAPVSWYVKGVPLLLVPPALALARARLWRRLGAWALLAGYHLALQALAGPGMRHRLSADPVWVALVGVLAAVVLAAAAPGDSALLRRARHYVARGRPRREGPAAGRRP